MRVVCVYVYVYVCVCVRVCEYQNIRKLVCTYVVTYERIYLIQPYRLTQN